MLFIFYFKYFKFNRNLLNYLMIYIIIFIKLQENNKLVY